jgi:hypothetical protein
MRGVGYVTCSNACRALVGKREGEKPLGSPALGRRIIKKLTSRKWVWRSWTRFVWLRIGTGEHDKETAGL